jgi:hypothetical protein
MDKIAGTFKLIENIKLDRVDVLTGQIIDSEEICNTIVNNGLERVSKLLNGVSATYFRAIGIGTGITGAAIGDTALETELTRAAAVLTYEASYKAKFVYTFTFGSDYSITEAGLFDSATFTGSTMLSRSTFTAKNVSTTVSLIVTWTISVARA